MTDENAGPATEAPTRNLVDGLPSPMDLASETLNTFMADMGPYVMLAVGQMVASLVALTILLPVIFGCYFGLIFGGTAVGAILIDIGGDAMEALGAMVMVFGIIAGYLSLILVSLVGGGILLGPFHGSTLRAIDDHLAGVRKASFTGAFDTAMKQPVADILSAVGHRFLVFLGFPILFVGPLAIDLFLHWWPAAVALDGMSQGSAFKRSFGHTKSHLSWHLGFYGLLVVFSIVAGQIPILGPAAVSLFAVKSYRAVFPREGAELIEA